MADTIKSTSRLKCDCMFVDGDTRSFNIKNPKDGITTTEIEELNTFMQTNNVIIGDKAGGTFGRISKVTKINEITNDMDIS